MEWYTIRFALVFFFVFFYFFDLKEINVCVGGKNLISLNLYFSFSLVKKRVNFIDGS